MLRLKGKSTCLKSPKDPRNVSIVVVLFYYHNTCPAEGRNAITVKVESFRELLWWKACKRSRRSEHPRSRNLSHPKQLKHIIPFVHSRSDINDEYLYHICGRLHANINVWGHSFDISIDTEASSNVIDRKTFLHLKDAHMVETWAKGFLYS